MLKNQHMNVIILGSTGSLGVQTLNVLSKYRKNFRIIGVSANTNTQILHQQAQKLGIAPENIVLASEMGAVRVEELAKTAEAEIIINMLSGTAGIEPTKAALKAGKIVLLGNKESLVAAGAEIMPLANGNLIPLDSEHNAIFEILQKFPEKKLKKIHLPCSGGPFLGKDKKFLQNITVEQALSHPRWQMGAKISIESATLLNKGFEVIEAHYLFGLPLEDIAIFIHPEAQIHGLVEFEDNETYAYISDPNMAEHIENGLLHAINKSKSASRIQKIDLKNQAFQSPDNEVFPGISIVLSAFRKAPSKMHQFLKKEEQVIEAFLQNKISFQQIFSSL